MNNVAFTIVAKNYVGFAQIVGQSIRRYNSNFDFYIFIADEFDEDELSFPDDGFKYIIAKSVIDLSIEMWTEMSFKYNLVEFCTAIKPFCFSYLLEKLSYKKVIYFDPDILVFNSLKGIEESLDQYKVLLTPHIVSMQESYTGDESDSIFLLFGIYNLGFLAVRNSEITIRLMKWWSARLINGCYFDVEKGLATDQKWALFFPNFLDNSELLITDNLGMNVAPWNFFEREILEENGMLYVTKRSSSKRTKTPLVFVHYSSCNYKSIQKNVFPFKQYKDTIYIFKAYKEALALAGIETFIHLKYSYQFYQNGVLITDFNRRLYRALLDKSSLLIVSGSPFSIEFGSFYACLKNKKLLSSQSTNTNNGHLGRFSSENGNKFRQLTIMNFLTKFLFRIMGTDRFASFIANAPKYFTFENQVHLLGEENSTPSNH